MRALALDRAVYAFGVALEGDMAEAEERVDPPDAKARSKIARIRLARAAVLIRYGVVSEEEAAPKRYAEPVARKASGVVQEVAWKA